MVTKGDPFNRHYKLLGACVHIAAFNEHDAIAIQRENSTRHEPRHPDMLLFNAPNQYRKCGRRHDGRPIKCNDFGLSGGFA
uniref:Uncharacterized protein n=1 Tax=Glossina morsitans morsitans TaxID=37546 RepID=A0A1B0FNU5_GLOMM